MNDDAPIDIEGAQRTLPTDTLMSLQFYAPGKGEALDPHRIVTITADGTIELGVAVAVGEAAAAFWEAVLNQRINYANRFRTINEAEKELADGHH